jgi:serine/threonine protein kinase
MKHEPWADVCPLTRQAIYVIPPAPPAIPAAPAIPKHTPATGIPRVTRSAPVPRPAPQAPRPAPAPAQPQGLAGRVIGDRYGVTKLIGEGGMGVVYEAEHLAIGKLVAVKVLHPQLAQDKKASSRLRHEARVAGTLGHPNICAIYDMGRLDDGSPYLVMERLHGETLAQRIARERRIAVPDLLDILLQVCSALAAAHQQGVVHRDLKPENIFLSRREGMRPVPKLVDFGISKAENVEDTMHDPTAVVSAMGTPYYMAPEQARGDRHIDYRVDLWAAGVVLYEGLTGQHPFEAKNYNALLVQILSMAHRPLREIDPDLSVGLAKVVDRALSKRPEDRYQSAMEYQSALRSYRDLEVEPPARPLPIVINEQTTDDSDATTVFSRIEVSAAGAPGQPFEEDATPIYTSGARVTTPVPPRGATIDDERTVVDPPAFLTESVNEVRREGAAGSETRGRKR